MYEWETIEKFSSWIEYERFGVWIQEQIASNFAAEISVESYFAGANFRERWIKNSSTREVWRLVEPDAPFPGYWGRVQLQPATGVAN